MAALIDFHTHFFSRVFFSTLASASPFSDDPEGAMERVAKSVGLELPPRDDEAHLARWQEALASHGVSHFVSFASVPEEIPVLAKMARLAEGTLSPFAVIDPSREGAAKKLEKLLEEDGFCGAVLFPALHHTPLDGPEAAEIFAVLDSHNAIGVVHCGMLRVPLRDRFGLPRNYDLSCSNPLQLVRVADNYPDARFVIPHFGAGMFRETLIVGAQTENVYVDTSSSNSWTATQAVPLELADVFERTLGVFGTERILFGTDSSVFPRGWRHDIFLAQREAMGACGLNNAEKAKILAQNAEHVLGIRAQTDAPRTLSQS